MNKQKIRVFEVVGCRSQAVGNRAVYGLASRRFGI